MSVPDQTYDDDRDHDDVPRRAGKHGQLTPFRKGDPRAADAGRKGGEVRRAQRAAKAQTVAALSRSLSTIAATFDRSELGRHAAAVGGYLLAQIAAGKIPIRNGDEAATLLRALVDVARLEEGQPTSTAVVAHLGTAEVLALRDQARRAIGAVIDHDQDHDHDRDSLSAAATAADDIPGDELEP